VFSHPKDFTRFCTTELGYMAKIKLEFDKRGVKVIGLSVDPVENHSNGRMTSRRRKLPPNYPMIATPIFRCQGVGHAAGGGER